MLDSHEAEKYDLVFRNLLNGVPPPSVAQAFQISPEEVTRIERYMMLKVRSYMHDRSMPTDRLDTLADAQRQRLMILWVVDRINLSKPPKYKRFERCEMDKVLKA